MRSTFGSLLTLSIDKIRDPRTTTEAGISDTTTYLKREINNTVRFISNYLDEYRLTGDAIEISTVADQQYYKYPPRLDFISNVTWRVGNIDYPLQTIESEKRWAELNMVDYSGSTVPQFIFPRKDDFGLYPIPRVNSEVITFNAHYTPKEMTYDDYTSGTVAATNGSATVTGTSTTWTVASLGNIASRWFKIDSDGDWYRITTRDSATQITLFRPFYGTTLSGANYIIGESPEIPTVLHELIPYRVAASWFMDTQRNEAQAQYLLNYFWTGDYNNPNRESTNVEGGLIGYIKRANKRGRERSQLINRKTFIWGGFDDRWRTTLTGA